MDKILGQVKGIAGFVVGFLAILVGRVTADDAVLPTLDPFDTKGWVLLVGGALVGYLGVYLAPANKLDTEQIQVQMDKLTPKQRVAVIRGRHAVVDPE